MRIAWDKTRDSAIGYSEKDIRLQRCANSSARDTLLSYLSFKFSLLAPDRMLTKVCHYTAFRRLWPAQIWVDHVARELLLIVAAMVTYKYYNRTEIKCPLSDLSLGRTLGSEIWPIDNKQKPANNHMSLCRSWSAP